MARETDAGCCCISVNYKMGIKCFTLVLDHSSGWRGSDSPDLFSKDIWKCLLPPPRFSRPSSLDQLQKHQSLGFGGQATPVGHVSGTQN